MTNTHINKLLKDVEEMGIKELIDFGTKLSLSTLDDNKKKLLIDALDARMTKVLSMSQTHVVCSEFKEDDIA